MHLIHIVLNHPTFQEIFMTDNTATAAAAAVTPATGMRSEIVAKWSKFTDADVTALKSKDDLVAQVQAKYSLDKAQAQKDVDGFAKGRSL
jgi:hypothetical protein